jgi:hypothetical protein
MPIWGWIIVVTLVVAWLLYHFRKPKLAVVKPASDPSSLGVQLRKGAEQIPVYGSFVKVAGVVGKPLNSALDRVNKTITSGIEHIPVVGKYLAIPNQVAGNYIKKFNNYIGL